MKVEDDCFEWESTWLGGLACREVVGLNLGEVAFRKRRQKGFYSVKLNTSELFRHEKKDERVQFS